VPVVVPQRALHARERVFARAPLPLARGRHRGLDPLERAREVEPAPRHRGQQIVINRPLNTPLTMMKLRDS